MMPTSPDSPTPYTPCPPPRPNRGRGRGGMGKGKSHCASRSATGSTSHSASADAPTSLNAESTSSSPSPPPSPSPSPPPSPLDAKSRNKARSAAASETHSTDVIEPNIDTFELAVFSAALALHDARSMDNPGRAKTVLLPALGGAHPAQHAQHGILSKDFLRQVLEQDIERFEKLLKCPCTWITLNWDPIRKTFVITIHPAVKGSVTFGDVLATLGLPLSAARTASTSDIDWQLVRRTLRALYSRMVRDLPISLLGKAIKPFMSVIAGKLYMSLLRPESLACVEAAASRIEDEVSEEDAGKKEQDAPNEVLPEPSKLHHHETPDETVYQSSLPAVNPIPTSVPGSPSPFSSRSLKPGRPDTSSNASLFASPAHVSSVADSLAFGAHELMSMLPLAIARNSPPTVPTVPTTHQRAYAPRKTFAASHPAVPKPISPRSAAFADSFMDFGSDHEVDGDELHDASAGEAVEGSSAPEGGGNATFVTRKADVDVVAVDELIVRMRQASMDNENTLPVLVLERQPDDSKRAEKRTEDVAEQGQGCDFLGRAARSGR